jgi:hypothetical protein
MPRRWKFAAWALGALVAAGVVVTVGAKPKPVSPVRQVPHAPHVPQVSAHPSPNPIANPPTADATADSQLPSGQWALPAPSRYEGLAAVGFLHTTLGAVALGYSALAARFTTDPDMAVSVVRATALAPTPSFLAEVAQGTVALRTRFGLAPAGPTPTTIGLSLIGCRVASASEHRVVVGYEGALSVEGGAVQGTTAQVSVAIALVWDGADWKIDPTTDLPTPPIEYPTKSAAATPGGWHVCSET